jgi:hypothetical protein
MVRQIESPRRGRKRNGGNGNNHSDERPPPRDPRLLQINPEVLLARLAKSGFTNDEIAEAIGLHPSTFYRIISGDEKLFEILEAAKSEPNHRVEQSLFKRAIGYTAKEITKADGKPIKVTIKEIVPEVLACIFWLKNRDPKRWRDAVDVSFTLKDRMIRAQAALKAGALEPKLLTGNGTDGEAEA